MEKKCTKCEEMLSLDKFYRQGKYYDSYCKPCRKILRRESFLKNKQRHYKLNKKWIENNKERYNEIRKISREKLRNECLYHYSNNNIECNCCGERENRFLTIDHINNDGNIKRRLKREPKGGVGFYTYLRKNNFPDGFQVLCFNCNQGKHFNGGSCPHKE